jgi:hypothetical protein
VECGLDLRTGKTLVTDTSDAGTDAVSGSHGAQPGQPRRVSLIKVIGIVLGAVLFGLLLVFVILPKMESNRAIQRLVDEGGWVERQEWGLSVYFGSNPWDGEDLALLRELRPVWYLHLDDNETLNHRHLRHLEGLAELTDLQISRCPGITDEGLKYLSSNVRTLTDLVFSECAGITVAGLEHLAQLPELDALTVWKCEQISDGQLAEFRDKYRGQFTVE